MNVLNPELYRALKRVFRRVKISNPGEVMNATYQPDHEGTLRLQPLWPGEYYVVACPFCHDTTGHLYINHRWGIRDPRNGTRNLWLAHCFLNDCLSDWDRRLELAERLAGYDAQARAGLVTVEAAREASPLSPVELPPDFSLLSELPKGHLARRYVRGRGFSPAELSRVWGVGFSVEGYYTRQGRLVIPLRGYLRDFRDRREVADHPDAWEVVGYQGRALSDEEKPKYLTSVGTAKSRLLYGLDHVPLDGDRPVVVCEGPTDVWRAGPGAVALLGKTASEAQCKLLRKMLPGRDVVIALDPDAATEALVAAQRIRSFLGRDLSGVRPGRVAVASLPDDRDPGDCSREEIWAAADKALARRTKRDRH